jgi:hypothetical protein
VDAKIKCSSCGAEISNLKLSWEYGKKQLLFMSIFFIPVAFLTVKLQWPKPDYSRELSARLIEVRRGDESLDVIGSVANAGKHDWDSVTVKADCYDKNGKYLDSADQYIPGSTKAGSEEKFRIAFRKPPREVLGPGARCEVRIAGARNYGF